MPPVSSTPRDHDTSGGTPRLPHNRDRDLMMACAAAARSGDPWTSRPVLLLAPRRRAQAVAATSVLGPLRSMRQRSAAANWVAKKLLPKKIYSDMVNVPDVGVLASCRRCALQR